MEERIKLLEEQMKVVEEERYQRVKNRWSNKESLIEESQYDWSVPFVEKLRRHILRSDSWNPATRLDKIWDSLAKEDKISIITSEFDERNSKHNLTIQPLCECKKRV